jgi:hypothetical protein
MLIFQLYGEPPLTNRLLPFLVCLVVSLTLSTVQTLRTIAQGVFFGWVPENRHVPIGKRSLP